MINGGMIMNRENIQKNYDPKDVEKRLYDFWMEKDYFHPEIDKSKEPYTICLLYTSRCV